MAKQIRQILNDERGVVMLEFLLAFPLVLTLLFATLQFAHLWIARQVVHYAAFCAARGMLVVPENEYNDVATQAAIQVCKWISIGKINAEKDLTISGQGTTIVITGSGGVARKTSVVTSMDEWNVGATVYFDFALITPLVGPMLAWGMNPWDTNLPWAENRNASGVRHQTENLEFPHVRITETAWLPKPYVTMSNMNL